MTNFEYPPRILFLYGSLRERSYSRLLAEEAARIIQEFGAEVKAANETIKVADNALELNAARGK